MREDILSAFEIYWAIEEFNLLTNNSLPLSFNETCLTDYFTKQFPEEDLSIRHDIVLYENTTVKEYVKLAVNRAVKDGTDSLKYKKKYAELKQAYTKLCDLFEWAKSA